MTNLVPCSRRVGAFSSQRRPVGATLGAATLLGPIGDSAANTVYAQTFGPDGRGDRAAIISALAVCGAARAC